MRPPRAKSRALHQSLFGGHQASIRLTVRLGRGLSGPPLPLRIEVLDPIFVLKVKVEVALRLLRETQGERVVSRLAVAEDIELECERAGRPERGSTPCPAPAGNDGKKSHLCALQTAASLCAT